MADYLTPKEITEYMIEAGIRKTSNDLLKSFLLAFMAGLFIALAAFGSMAATSTIQNYGVASVVSGVIFSTGLMMVVIAGGDLFTGNVLIIAAVMHRKVKAFSMVLNLVIVYIGNFVGAIAVALMINYSGLLNNANGAIVQKLMVKAAHKMELSFVQALLLGIMCNILVCISVWMMYSAKDTGGKVLACLFPISLFILSGYEHIVANMYYIPAGILARMNESYIILSGLSVETVSNITLGHVAGNFLPVTLGNLLGGIIVGVVYSIIYKNDNSAKALNNKEISL